MRLQKVNHAAITLLDPDAAPETGDEAAPGKRELTKAQNREAILAAARAVFAELGYEAASVRDIVRRTGLASGTFYNYYRSKEEVAKALAADVAQRLGPVLRAQREQAQDFESYLKGAIRAYFQFIQDELAGWADGTRKPRADRFMPHIRAYTPAEGAVFEEIQASLTLAIGQGLANSVDTEFVTAAMIGVAQKVGEKMLARERVDLDGAVAFAVGMILHGLSALRRQETR
jgi:AcrR family transcriptional regulator